MSGWPIDPDGTVIASSQLNPEEFDYHIGGMPVIGIVISVQPSDDKGNLSSSVEDDNRGHRHEATVLVLNSAGEDNWLLENVVIPPRNRSNHDDYDEDLPVGISKVLDGSALTENWKSIDPSLLDGDYCVVNFIGGSMDMPFIQGWWPHPKNKIDPATSTRATLTQVDSNKQRTRTFRRINGVKHVINKAGDVYFSTSEAGSKLDLSGDKPVRRDVTGGGSVQINIKSSQQLEFNWNPEVEGLKAGSNSQSQTRDPDLPHLDQSKASGAPAARSVDNTIIRAKQQEITLSTGKTVIYCKESGGGDGFFMATAEDGLVIGQGASGSVLASLTMTGGGIVLSTPDGSNVTIQDDSIMISASGGAGVLLQGGSVSLISPSGISLGTAVPTDFTVLGTTFLATYLPMINAMDAVLKAAQAPVAALTATKQAVGTIGTGNALVPLFDAILDSGKLTALITTYLAHTLAAPAPAATVVTTPWLSKTVSVAK